MSGSPGSGKSTVAALLRPGASSIEVGELALMSGLGRRHRGSVLVDLPALQRRFPRLHAARPHDVYVGHLAHLLPIRDVVILRCDPLVLAARLRRAHRGSARDRYDNAVSEAIDLVLREALGRGRRVWEVDTTGRSPAQVAREVGRHIRRRGPSDYGRVRWLADGAVTDYLLDAAR